MSKRKLMIVADAGVDTGFAQVSHNLIHHLKDQWEINVLAINYHGDPHPIQKEAQLWNPAGVIQGDYYGTSRLDVLSNNLKPDIVLFINDPWVVADYVPLFPNVYGKKVAYMPMDAPNLKPMYGERLNELDHIIAYTDFARKEFQYAGITKDISAIPHGVDTNVFFPLNRTEVRNAVGIDPSWYIVQVVDRNSRRKRLDLAIYAFSEWVRTKHIPDHVRFYYHGALKDEGYDLIQLGQYLDQKYLREYGKTPGISARIIITATNLNPAHGLPLERMNMLYNVANVKFSGTMGEGWGLTTMESMVCGIPNIVPKWSALAEWANGGVEYVDIADEPEFNLKGLNTQGGVPSLRSSIKALDKLYRSAEYRTSLARKGYELVTQPKFQWKNIASEFHAIFEGLLQHENGT